MLIAATAEAPNKLLMEKKREAFEQVTAQAQVRKSKERVGVDASSLFTRFGGRTLEHHSSKTDDNKGDKQV
jgi:hypothetical protein